VYLRVLCGYTVFEQVFFQRSTLMSRLAVVEQNGADSHEAGRPEACH
jgi:hypothetical protein